MLVKHNVVVPIKRGDVFTISTSRRDGTILKRDIVVIMHDDMIIRRKKILCANIYDDEPEYIGEDAIGLVQFIKDGTIKTIHLDETCFKDIGSLMDIGRSYTLASSVLELCNNELLKLINPIDTQQFKQLPVPEQVVKKVLEEEEPVIRRPLIKPIVPPKKQEVVEPPKEEEEVKIECNIKDGKLIIPKLGITLNDIAKAGNVELSLVKRNVIASLRADNVPEGTTLLTQEEAIKICNRMKIAFDAEPVSDTPKEKKVLSNKVKTLIESSDFIETAEMYKDGTISAKDAVEILNISPYQFRYAYGIWKLNFDEEVEIQTTPEVVEDQVAKQRDPREELLKDLNVMIIGGTEIWHNKLKAMFPKWEYVRASAPTNKVVNVSRRDLIYVFDKHLSHATWYAYSKACKSAGKEWKFLKRVSIPDNINTFYNDAVERGLITKEV